ncbi:hypothetical protein AVEN_3260-2-1, partial [Araneus ventricosus]
NRCFLIIPSLTQDYGLTMLLRQKHQSASDLRTFPNNLCPPPTASINSPLQIKALPVRCRINESVTRSGLIL